MNAARKYTGVGAGARGVYGVASTCRALRSAQNTNTYTPKLVQLGDSDLVVPEIWYIPKLQLNTRIRSFQRFISDF